MVSSAEKNYVQIYVSSCGKEEAYGIFKGLGRYSVGILAAVAGHDFQHLVDQCRLVAALDVCVGAVALLLFRLD